MTNESAPAARIASLDILRGVVILLMMLDHVRERFYMHTRTGDPMFESIDPDLYITRYLTHLCAPVFIFLAGLSAWLYAHPAAGQHRSPSGFLFKRGLVIVLIELVLYYLVWADSYPSFLFLQVLWAIGLCMIGLSLACRLNYWLLGALGLLIVFGHNVLGPIDFEPWRARIRAVDRASRPQRTRAGRGVDDQRVVSRAAVVRSHSAWLLCRAVVCAISLSPDKAQNATWLGRSELGAAALCCGASISMGRRCRGRHRRRPLRPSCRSSTSQSTRLPSTIC